MGLEIDCLVLGLQYGVDDGEDVEVGCVWDKKHLTGTKDVILIPNDYNTSTSGTLAILNPTESQWIARTERQRLQR